MKEKIIKEKTITVEKKQRSFKQQAILFFLLFSCSFGYAQNNLELQKLTVISRHGVRSPLEQYLETLDSLTGDGYHWTRWSVPGSNLTLRGGALEILHGDYFRLWLDSEGFTNGLKEQDIYFGASSKQRTVATARAFAAGLFPLLTVPVDYKLTVDSTIGYLDPNYLPLFYTDDADGHFDTNAFKEEAKRELGELIAPSYLYLEEILRIKSSLYAKQNGMNHFDKKVGVCLDFYDTKNGKRREPTMVGGLKIANMASDALILKYLENDTDTIFGDSLSFDDWKKLASIKDYYSHILFSKAPIISVNVSHCMLKRVYSEMISGGHKFAFFCTHDSMIEALLAALRVTPYELQGTIESKTPLGCKVLFEEWSEKGPNLKKYVRVRLVYQSSEQIREIQRMDLENPPMSYEFTFTGLDKAPNGMYRYDDFMNHLQKSIQAYQATAKGENPWK